MKRQAFLVSIAAVAASFIVAAVVPSGSHDVCAGAACKPDCECRTTTCDVTTCLMDEDCYEMFTCSVLKCPCSSGDSGDSQCIKTCAGHSRSAVTSATLACFLKQCRLLPFNFLAKSITNSRGGAPCFLRLLL